MGAHLNPGVTLAFYSLGKIHGSDAVFYMLAQFAGGIAGVSLASLLIGEALGDPSVNYAVTMPGPKGPWVAFGAEFLISFLMIMTVLTFSNSKRLTRWTPLIAGTMVATFIFDRSTAFRHEHESGAHSRFGRTGQSILGAVGLLHGPRAGNAAGGSHIRDAAWRACDLLREGAPPQ